MPRWRQATHFGRHGPRTLKADTSPNASNGKWHGPLKRDKSCGGVGSEKYREVTPVPALMGWPLSQKNPVSPSRIWLWINDQARPSFSRERWSFDWLRINDALAFSQGFLPHQNNSVAIRFRVCFTSYECIPGWLDQISVSNT